MKHKLTVSLLTATLLQVCAAHGQITNLDVVGGQINNAANWSNGLPSLTTTGIININANINAGATGWIVNHTGGTATSIANRAFGGGTIWNLQGATIDFGTNAWNSASGGYTLNVESGSFTSGNVQLTNSSALNLSGGTMSVSNSASNTGSVINVSGGSLTSSGSLSIASGTATFTGGTVSITDTFTTNGAVVTFGLGNASVSAGALSTTGGTQINFFPGSAGSLAITGFGLSDYQTLWNSNILRFDGGNVGSFDDHFQVSGSTLSVIPEPSTYAMLLGLAAIGLALVRRRRVVGK